MRGGVGRVLDDIRLRLAQTIGRPLGPRRPRAVLRRARPVTLRQARRLLVAVARPRVAAALVVSALALALVVPLALVGLLVLALLRACFSASGMGAGRADFELSRRYIEDKSFSYRTGKGLV